jgi:hypothetical protein
VDPDSLNLDLDPIPIQGFDNQKMKKQNTDEQFFLSQLAIYLSLGLHKGHLSYRRSLQPSKENIQHLKK